MKLRLLPVALGLLVLGCIDAPTLGPGVYCDSQTPCDSDRRYPMCDTATHQCVTVFDAAAPVLCISARDCTKDSPICDPHGACAPCTGAASDDAACAARDPAQPRCDPKSGRCGLCRADTARTDCPLPAAPVCDQGACRACRAHSECASKVCGAGGRCTAASDIVYVDNRGDSMCAGVHTGAQDDAYCQIADAVAAIGVRTIIRVAGSAVAYHRVDTTGVTQALSFIGPGLDAATLATVKDPGGPCFNLADAPSVTIDGFVVTGCTGGIVANRPIVTLIRTRSHPNSGPGVELRFGSGGTHRLDGVIIHDNMAGGLGLYLVDDYDIQNCFIADNHGDFGGVWIGSYIRGAGRFAFNTVRRNVSAMYSSGVHCNPVGASIDKRLLEASIVIENTSANNNGQFSSDCQLQYVVAGVGESFKNAMAVDPVWAPSLGTDYHLARLPSNAMLINAISGAGDGGTGSYIDHDIEGAFRPQSKLWDIGAQEVQ